jgi:SAM-dependent methyltransferase
MIDSSKSAALAARVARERAAHEDGHIDDALRKWWAVFPHVFSNPSMVALSAFYAHELGPVLGRRVLEYGCGKGDFTFWLLDQGARVTGIDVSKFNIDRCKEKALALKIDPARYDFIVMDAHQLSFPDHSFELLLGNGILHHLELSLAMTEIARVLQPGARALFQEPLGENPLLKLYRALARIHTTDERPLLRSDVDYLRREWSMQVRYSGLLTLPLAIVTSLILRPYPNNWLLRVAAGVEERLNDKHVLDHWNRFAVLVYQSPPSGGVHA